MLIETTRELLKEIKKTVSENRSEQKIPGNVFFMKDGNVLCLERHKGESRFPYANDGYILWVHSTGHIHVKSGVFNVFKPVYDGNNINAEFIAGIKTADGSYFPISLTGAAKQLFEPFHVKRYLAYTLSAAYFVTETDVADFVVRASMSSAQELQFSVGCLPKTETPAEVYIASYFDPFLKDGEADNMWEYRTRKCRYEGGGKFIAYRTGKKPKLGIKRAFSGAEILSSEATAIRAGILGGERGTLNASPALKTGEFFKDVLLSGGAIASEMIRFKLENEARIDYVLPLDMQGDKINKLLETPVSPSAIDKEIERAEASEREKFGRFTVTFRGTENGVSDFALNEFFKKVQKQVDNCATGRYYVDDLMGVRDVYQQLEQALIWNGGQARRQMLSALGFLMKNGRAPRQYSLPLSEDENPKMDWREFIDQGNWIISCFYSYLAWTGDYGILNEDVGYTEVIGGKTYCRNEQKDSALQHLLKITEYLISNLDTQDGTNCLRILFGDWNDSINGLGQTKDEGRQFGTGVSVMASLHLYQNLSEMAQILKKIGGYEDTVCRYGKIRETLKNGILKNAVETNAQGKMRVVHGWGDHGSYKIGSFCDSDGASRISFAPYAFWATSDLIEETPQFKNLLIENILALRSKYGLLTLTPAFSPSSPGVGKIAGIPKGTAENECVYVHAAMFSVLALFRLGQAETAWAEFYKILPIANPQMTKTPFVMSNSYLDNPDLGYFGQSPIDWYTGSGTVCLKNIIRGLMGVNPDLDGILLRTANKMPCKSLCATCTIKGKKLRFEYENTGAGKRTFSLNGKPLAARFDELTETPTAYIPEKLLEENNLLKVCD